MAEATRISYLAPVFEPAIGGGVVYVAILARELPARIAGSVFAVVTEAYPGSPAHETRADGKVEVHRVFPFRAGQSTRGVGAYVAYAMQNAQFFGLYRWLPRRGVLFVHGSFFNNPGAIWPALRLVRRLRPQLRLILDLRDPKFPASLARKANWFDATVSCSRNISARLPGVEHLWDIPVMIEQRHFGVDESAAVLARHHLEGRRYVFNGSGFNEGKGSSELLELVREIRKRQPDIVLAVAGKRRHWTPAMESAVREGWLLPLGIIASIDVRAISAASWLDANLSRVDSFPRHSLEALASGARVLLPAGVPEFADTCPEHIGDASRGASTLAEQAIAIADGAIGSCPYPWRQHLPDAVMAQYVDLIASLH